MVTGGLSPANPPRIRYGCDRKNDCPHLCAFHGWLPICSSGGQRLGTRTKLISIYGWAMHLKEDRLGAALPMHFSRKCSMGSRRICDLQSRLPQANAPDMFFVARAEPSPGEPAECEFWLTI